MLLLRRTILSSASRADRVLALSETCRDILIDNGISQEKIVVAPNGVDPSWGYHNKTIKIGEAFGIRKSFLLYVSHFYRYKNHFRLLDAFKMLPKTFKESHQLVLVGKPSDMEYYLEVQRYINISGLKNEVIQIPGLSQPQLKVLYQSTALFIFPSLIENSPNSLLEAMMAGSPVIAGSRAPMREFCGTAAIYFDPLSVIDIRNKIVMLLENDDLRHCMRRHSVEQAGKYTWDDFVRVVAEQIDHIRL
jgi:glycosyltransferase involved in cell wall biosynthesis